MERILQQHPSLHIEQLSIYEHVHGEYRNFAYNTVTLQVFSEWSKFLHVKPSMLNFVIKCMWKMCLPNYFMKAKNNSVRLKKFRFRRKITVCSRRNKDSKGGNSKWCTLPVSSKSPAFTGLNSGRYGCYSCAFWKVWLLQLCILGSHFCTCTNGKQRSSREQILIVTQIITNSNNKKTHLKWLYINYQLDALIIIYS